MSRRKAVVDDKSIVKSHPPLYNIYIHRPICVTYDINKYGYILYSAWKNKKKRHIMSTIRGLCGSLQQTSGRLFLIRPEARRETTHFCGRRIKEERDKQFLIYFLLYYIIYCIRISIYLYTVGASAVASLSPRPRCRRLQHTASPKTTQQHSILFPCIAARIKFFPPTHPSIISISSIIIIVIITPSLNRHHHHRSITGSNHQKIIFIYSLRIKIIILENEF